MARPSLMFVERQRGFTLIELLVVVSVLAIMAALAAPGMTQLLAGQRLKSAATDLHLALMKARGEAIKRNSDVTVSPAGDSWASGWSVTGGSPAVALETHGPTASVSVTTTATSVVYRGTGRTTPATAGAAFVFSASGTESTRCLSLDPSGKPYVKEGSAC